MELEKSLAGSFNVFTMNFSGHGGSPVPAEPFSIEMFAGDILKFLDSAGIDSANIFGYSMGGYAAIYLAKAHPDRIKKIFTLATKFLWSEEVAAREVRKLDAEKIKEKVPKFARELFIRHGFFLTGKTVLAKTAEMMINLGKNNTLKTEDFGGN
jgi:pimeloyl-ACP methyl ester carboxylesterase